MKALQKSSNKEGLVICTQGPLRESQTQEVQWKPAEGSSGASPCSLSDLAEYSVCNSVDSGIFFGDVGFFWGEGEPLVITPVT